MTGIQALERIAPGLPMMPGKVERREFEYRRHGTQTLIAAFDVATGKVEGVIGKTRTEKDFARFLRSLLTSAMSSRHWPDHWPDGREAEARLSISEDMVY